MIPHEELMAEIDTLEFPECKCRAVVGIVGTDAVHQIIKCGPCLLFRQAFNQLKTSTRMQATVAEWLKKEGLNYRPQEMCSQDALALIRDIVHAQTCP